MPTNSRLSGLRDHSPAERRRLVAEAAGLADGALDALDPATGLGIEQADHLIENVIGVMGIPVGIATNFTVNGIDRLVPMATEEPSVVAAASNAARMARDLGGFRTSTTGDIMIAQIQVVDTVDPEGARLRLLEAREELLARLKQHITDVMTRYKGKIYAWDVVNEAVPDTGKSIYRESKFYQIIGEDYIQKAFEYAHAVDPQAKLFYNDYNTESAVKREKIYQLVKKLKDKNVPIDGVGLQAHWSINEPTQAELEKSITKFAGLGLAVQITELDVSVYPKEHERREKKATDKSEFTPEMEQKQAAHYKMIFDTFRKYKGTVTGVTFWNVSDKSSWLDNFPVPGRKDYPLLFDQNYKPKKAFDGVVNF